VNDGELLSIGQRLEAVEEQPLERRAESYVELLGELQAALEAADEPRRA
jgi:hypothetical protein